MTVAELILQHTETPKYFGRIKGFTTSGAARGPEHEDFIAFQSVISHGRITEIAWQGDGCSVTMAAASILAEALKGKSAGNYADITDRTLDRLHAFNKSCVEVVREAADACFTFDEKERGTCKIVTK
jgi:NifU-like protein involved in Fe-S cluster formation